MTGPVVANVFIGGGGTSSNDGTRTKVSKDLEANNDYDKTDDKEKSSNLIWFNPKDANKSVN